MGRGDHNMNSKNQSSIKITLQINIQYLRNTQSNKLFSKITAISS